MKHIEKPLVVGVTGIMGAGKTEVARVFEQMGAVLIDADAMGKAMLREPAVRDSLVAAFGEEIKGPGGEIDTARLGERAFATRADAHTLDGLTRDALISRILAAIEAASGAAEVIVVDAALLAEWRARSWLDVLVVVDAEESRAIQRLEAESRFTGADVRARMDHQMPRAAKADGADIVISNNGSLEDLKARAQEVYKRLVGGDTMGRWSERKE